MLGRGVMCMVLERCFLPFVRTRPDVFDCDENTVYDVGKLMYRSTVDSSCPANNKSISTGLHLPWNLQNVCTELFQETGRTDISPWMNCS